MVNNGKEPRGEISTSLHGGELEIYSVPESSSSSSSASSSEIRNEEPEKRSAPIDEATMEEINRVFEKYDTNGDGRISREELGAGLRALGCNLSPAELGQAMAEMDKDGNGFVDLTEFAAFYGRGRSEGSGDARAELRAAFAVYDKDGDGWISAKELHEVLRKLGEKVSLKDCVRMIESVDLDGDGCVDFEEFVMMMSKKSAPRRG